MNRICENCKKEFKWKGHGSRCGYCYIKMHRAKIKNRCLEYKGGKCERCGYDKCKRALCFHHLDPSKKDFPITDSEHKKWEIIQTELDKCILLCANCHAEEHERLDGIVV